MTQEERNEIKAIVREVLQEDGVYIDDNSVFPLTDNPGEDALAWYMTQGTQNYGRTPLIGGGGDVLVSVTWSGGSISPSTLRPLETATLTKGTVTATFQSGRTVDVTASAVFSALRGVISGTSYIAPVSTGSDTISASYGGMTASSTISVTVEGEPVAKKSVQVGHGSSYANAIFSDTSRQLTNNMIVTINKDAGDYIFIKVDKRDTVNNLYTYPGPNMSSFEYPVALDGAVIDGDYKYYKSTNRMNAGETSYKINRTN